MQQVVQNPLASPTTFGVGGGAGLALGIGLVAAPTFAAEHRPALALLGAGLAFALVVAVAARHRLAPLRLALAGLLVSLACGAGVTSLYLLQGRSLGALAIWGAGSLDQRVWEVLATLWPQTALAFLGIALLLRPLRAIQLGDGGARSLGIPVLAVRAAGSGLAVWLGAAAVGGVGVIGFVDLAAASGVRLLGARRLGERLLWAAPVGAATLWLADALAQWATRLLAVTIPTGAVAGLLGAPILMVLAALSRTVPDSHGAPLGRFTRRGALRLALLALALGVATVLALCLGRGPQGWHWSTGPGLADLLPWRAPRVAAAIGAGVLLALAGVTTQRLFANPMASPELLGIGAAASLAVCIVLAAVPDASRSAQWLTGLAVSLLALGLLVATSVRTGAAASRLALTGIGLSAFLGTCVSTIVAIVPFDTSRVIAWVGGSTYYADATDALFALVSAMIGLGAVLLLSRWLDLMALGDEAARAVGVPLRLARSLVLLLSAALCASGTLLIGPFAFVGLMAPHLARLCGFRRAGSLSIGAALIGALVLVASDLVSRNVFFPYQLPAGTTATLLGLMPTVWLLRR